MRGAVTRANHVLQPNPAIAFWLQSTRPGGRVADLGSLGGIRRRSRACAELSTKVHSTR